MDSLQAPSMPSQLELDALDFIPRDYDKDMHDHLKHTFVCECISFTIAHIPNREPLRLVFVDRYEPRRMETPRWVDAWEEFDCDEYYTPILIDLDAISSTMKKVSVYRPRPLGGDGDSTLYALRWATIHAQSGFFNDTVEDVDNESESEDN